MQKHIKYSLLALLLFVFSFALISCASSELSVVFVVDGERYATVKASAAEEIDMPDAPVKDEHVFDGWFLDSGRWSVRFHKDYFIENEYSSDLYVYAKWTSIHTHTAGDFIITAPSTCSAEGVMVKKCIHCDEVLETSAAPLIPHTEVTVKGYAATETNDGLTDGSYCSVCNKIVRSQNQIPALIQGTELRSELFEINGNVLSLTLANSECEISISENLKVNYKATASIFIDEACNVPIDEPVLLSEGDNRFYITVKNGEESKTYELNIRRRPKYTLTFFSDSETVSEFEVEEGSLATVPELNVSKIGYTFEGWDYDFDIPISEDTSVTAIWLPKQDTAYTVEYYTVNDDGTASLLGREYFVGATDSPVIAKIIEFENHTYLEDLSTPSGNILADGSLVLKIYYKKALLTVRFDTGCNEKIDELSLSFNSLIEEPKKLAFGDLEFMGWYLGEEKWNFDTDTVTESITLAARWGYRVTFILDGAESFILVESGKTFKKEDTPEADNEQVLIQWFISETNEVWRYNTPVTKHIKLTGKKIPVLAPDLNQ